MLQAFSYVYLGMMLVGIGVPANECFEKNDWEAVKYFKKAAVEYKLPAGLYFYGRSLVRGTGGIKRNIPFGITLLHQAGAMRIGEAFFELGWLYEGGMGEDSSLPGADT